MDLQLPLDDAIIGAVAQLIDDARSAGDYREPSHSELDFFIGQVGLSHADPKQQGQLVGKAKRVRAVLYTALTENRSAGARLVALVLGKVRACGGFRAGSPNFVGHEAILNAQAAFQSAGITLHADGTLQAPLLAGLKGAALSAALQRYALRAQQGAQNAAPLAGTGKDLLEATAAHVLQTLRGNYPQQANFHGLLGMAFMELQLAVPELPAEPGESPLRGLERALFQSAIAVNRLRNKQGTGHGRPWLPSVTDDEAKAAIETVGTVTAYLLAKLRSRTG